MFLSDKWLDYSIIDTSAGEKLERWGDRVLIRPDPQIIWRTEKVHPLWNGADARYIRSSEGGGKWETVSLPEVWQISYRDLIFNVKPMGFKHTGVFPEQAYNWDFCGDMIGRAARGGRAVSVLNLFAYTGGATLACARAGASVCHVDASKGMTAWAKENAHASGLDGAPIRYIVDDCKKFVEREIRRGRRYDGIIMDPPSYGRGPSGEIWKLEDALYPLVSLCAELLSDDALFFLINSYTTGLSPSVMSYILGCELQKKRGGELVADELGLPVENGLSLPCGSSAYWLARPL